MNTSIHDVRGAGAVKKTIGWLMLVLLVTRLAAAETSSIKPTAILLPAGISGLQIQQALDALPATGGEVVVPAGLVEVTQPIVLQRDNQILRGSGISTVLRLADNANCPVIILGDPINTPTQIIRHLLVTGFFVDGNRVHQNRELWRLAGEGSQIRNNGITVQGVEDCTVQGVVTAHCRSGGLVTTRETRRLTVRGLESFDNEFDGLACYETEDSLFADLNLHNNPGAGISLDLAFNHNIISNAILVANDLGIFMRASRENEFLNVTIKDSRHLGVFMAHTEQPTATGWGPAPKTACVCNGFTNLVAIDCGGAAFRVNNTTCTNNVITRANFTGNGNGGLSQARPDLVTVR